MPPFSFCSSSRKSESKPNEKVAALLDELSAADEVERLANVPQDDRVERAGAEGESVFTFDAGSPALAAAAKVVETLRSADASGQTDT